MNLQLMVSCAAVTAWNSERSVSSLLEYMLIAYPETMMYRIRLQQNKIISLSRPVQQHEVVVVKNSNAVMQDKDRLWPVLLLYIQRISEICNKYSKLQQMI